MKYNEAVKIVDNFEEFRYRFGLARIRKFLCRLDSPQDKLKIIHIAGTNGKGSVAAYISTILQNAGYKVGLYTSPHLLDIRERIQINNKKITKKDFTQFVFNYTLHSTPYTLTYFEFLTAMAFWYFAKENVNFAVIEVGLGGRLDATNVIKNPLVSIITNISLEHTQYLGNTTEKIAKEKAGIIKTNGTVITSCYGKALKKIQEIASSKNAKVIKIQNNRNYKISLFGEHQQQNASLAVAVCRFLSIPEKYIITGLQNTYWPARFEVKQFKIKNSKLKIVLDVVHNPAGMLVLKNSIKKYFGKKINFVFGVLADKDYKKMVRIIAPIVKNVFISAPENNRALSPQIVQKEFLAYISPENIFVFSNIKKAIKFAIANLADLCITGSTYTVGEALRAIKN
ncbi:MAG: folylpolyglutamate synthase/dihydrofolate synthase family protein [Elusimicrobiota bacterium]